MKALREKEKTKKRVRKLYHKTKSAVAKQRSEILAAVSKNSVAEHGSSSADSFATGASSRPPNNGKKNRKRDRLDKFLEAVTNSYNANVARAQAARKQIVKYKAKLRAGPLNAEANRNAATLRRWRQTTTDQLNKKREQLEQARRGAENDEKVRIFYRGIRHVNLKNHNDSEFFDRIQREGYEARDFITTWCDGREPEVPY